MRSKILILALAGAIVGTAQTVGRKIDFPADSPVTAVSSDWSETRETPRGGAYLLDVHAVLSLRARYKDKFNETFGVSLGLMSFFARATTLALKAFPVVNASIEGKRWLGSFARARRHTASKPAGMPRRSVEGAGAGWVSICRTISTSGAEGNGRRPVSSSNRIAPTRKTAAAQPIAASAPKRLGAAAKYTGHSAHKMISNMFGMTRRRKSSTAAATITTPNAVTTMA